MEPSSRNVPKQQDDGGAISPTPTNSRLTFASGLLMAACCIAITVVVLWLLSVPLGIPGEWTWSRTPFSIETAITWSLSGIGLAIYVLAAWRGDAALRRNSSGRSQVCWLVLLVLLACGWWWAVLQSMPGIYGYARAPFVLYYPGSSGYFLQARDQADDLKAFLNDYEELLSEEDYLHIGTHPPGLTSCYRLLLEECRRNGTLRSTLLWCEPTAMRESMSEIRTNLAVHGQKLESAEEACLVGAALCTQWVFLLGAVALYGLLRFDYPPTSAWRVAAFWPLIPGALVFFPKSDLLFPTLGLACACCWFHGLHRRSAVLCALSGAIAWTAMMLSLAIAPVLVVIALATLWRRPWHAVENDVATSAATGALILHRLIIPIAWGALGFLLPTLAIWWWSGMNLFAVWSWNLHNHALFYDHNPRTWWAWLLVNPLEFAMTLGLPVACFSIVCCWQGVRSPSRATTYCLLMAWSIVMAALWLSGKNMGEAARLWLVFSPWPLIALAGHATLADADDASSENSNRAWLTLLVAQGICCLLTVTRVDGFHFDQLLGG